MKKGKRKVGFIIGCVGLSILLAISGYISMVVVGVIADENKNGTLIKNDNLAEISFIILSAIIFSVLVNFRSLMNE